MLISGAMLLAVILVNGHQYGAYTIIESDLPAYKAAFGALLRVKPPIQKALIPVSKATRELIYPISPAFKELQPYLEGEVGDAYINLSSNQGSQVEINGAFFNWALNESAARAGYYSRGSYPHEYYRMVAAEINQACDTGVLDCYPKRSSLASPWQPGYLAKTINNFLIISRTTIALDQMKFLPRGYENISSRNPAFEEITLENTWIIENRGLIRGWVIYTAGPVNITVTTADGQKKFSKTRFSRSEDVKEFFLKQGLELPNMADARFELTTSCTSPCFLEFGTEAGVLARLPIDPGIIDRYAENADGLYYHIDAYDSIESNARRKTLHL